MLHKASIVVFNFFLLCCAGQNVHVQVTRRIHISPQRSPAVF